MSSQAPSVLFIGNFLSGMGGRRAICEELIDRLKAWRWRISSSSAHPAKAVRLADMMASCWRQGRSADVAHVDVFSGSAFVWAELSCWMLRRAGCPYILTLRGGNLPKFAERWPGRVRRLLQSAAAVTVPSGYLHEAMLRYRQDLKLLPNAIELSAYPCRLRDSALPRLVWVRSFHRIYNPPLAIEVLARLVPLYPGIHLTMVGPDKDGSLGETQAAAARLGVIDRVTFVPGVRKHEVPQYLAAGDVFLNTTNIDNMPVTVVEAMACGLCVVSTNAGGVPYIVEDGRTGLLAPTRDAAAMAAAIGRVLDEPGLAQSLSHNARRYAEQFDWEIVLGAWRDLLTSISRRQHG